MAPPKLIMVKRTESGRQEIIKPRKGSIMGMSVGVTVCVGNSVAVSAGVGVAVSSRTGVAVSAGVGVAVSSRACVAVSAGV